MTSHRTERAGEAIREALSLVILHELQDPRLPGIFTLTAVRVTPDFSDAKVYFTQVPDGEKDIADSLAMLESATGFLRKRLAQEVNLRITPRLRFYHDEQARRGERIEMLLEEEARKRKERES